MTIEMSRKFNTPFEDNTILKLTFEFSLKTIHLAEVLISKHQYIISKHLFEKVVGLDRSALFGAGRASYQVLAAGLGFGIGFIPAPGERASGKRTLQKPLDPFLAGIRRLHGRNLDRHARALGYLDDGPLGPKIADTGRRLVELFLQAENAGGQRLPGDHHYPGRRRALSRRGRSGR